MVGRRSQGEGRAQPGALAHGLLLLLLTRVPACLQGCTHDTLQDMGKRLADELLEFISPFVTSTRR